VNMNISPGYRGQTIRKGLEAGGARGAGKGSDAAGVAAVVVPLVLLTVLMSVGGFADSHGTDFTARRAEAERASGGSRAKLFVDLAHDEMEAANQAFTAGDVEKGHKIAAESLADAQRGAEAAATSGKRLKETEIGLRKLELRTRDIARSLAFEDRPEVEKIGPQLEQLRQTLLDRLFSDKKKKKSP
jgi:hypothetical protein